MITIDIVVLSIFFKKFSGIMQFHGIAVTSKYSGKKFLAHHIRKCNAIPWMITGISPSGCIGCHLVLLSRGYNNIATTMLRGISFQNCGGTRRVFLR